MTSPLNLFAISTARSLLPVAVGPTIAKILGSDFFIKSDGGSFLGEDYRLLALVATILDPSAVSEIADCDQSDCDHEHQRSGDQPLPQLGSRVVA